MWFVLTGGPALHDRAHLRYCMKLWYRGGSSVSNYIFAILYFPKQEVKGKVKI